MKIFIVALIIGAIIDYKMKWGIFSNQDKWRQLFVSGSGCGKYRNKNVKIENGKHIVSKRLCFHRFEIKDVCNTKIDPKCVGCDKTLSELSHVSPSNLLVNSHIIGHNF